jgi:hypothetical protein
VDVDAAGTYSDVQSVEIARPGLQVALWPNRVLDQCRIRVNTASAVTAQIDVYDARLVPTGLHWSVAVDQELEMQLPVESLPAGSYVVVIRTDAEQTTMRFVKR